MRDFQRSRIERAEERWAVAHNTKLYESWELHQIAKKICGKAWWRKNFGLACEYAGDFHAGALPCLPLGKTIPARPPNNMLTLLHGMAHVALGHTHSMSGKKLMHEPDFVKVYLDLIDRFYDRGSAADGVKKEFKRYLMAEGVRTKAVSDETRQKMRDAWVSRQTPSEDSLKKMLLEMRDMELHGQEGQFGE